MALMPAPPMPTTWTRRGACEIRPGRARTGGSATGVLLGQRGHRRGRIGTGQARGPRRPWRQAWSSIPEQAVELGRQPAGVQLGVR